MNFISNLYFFWICGVVMPLLSLFFLIFPPLSTYIGMAKQNNQTTTSNFPCNFNFTVSNMNRFN